MSDDPTTPINPATGYEYGVMINPNVEALEAEMLKIFSQIEFLQGKIIGLRKAIEIIRDNNICPHGGKADISEEMLG